MTKTKEILKRKIMMARIGDLFEKRGNHPLIFALIFGIEHADPDIIVRAVISEWLAVEKSASNSTKKSTFESSTRFHHVFFHYEFLRDI